MNFSETEARVYRVLFDGAEAYLGTTINGFPNLFMIIGPNTGLGHSSMILQIESQVQYVMGALKTLETCRSVEVSEPAQSAFNEPSSTGIASTTPSESVAR